MFDHDHDLGSSSRAKGSTNWISIESGTPPKPKRWSRGAASHILTR